MVKNFKDSANVLYVYDIYIPILSSQTNVKQDTDITGIVTSRAIQIFCNDFFL